MNSERQGTDMKKIIVLLVALLVVLTSCKGKVQLSDDEILTAIRENNTAEKLKERYKNIYYKDARSGEICSFYDDRSSTATSYFDDKGVITKTTIREKDFLYTLEQDGSFSQEIVLKEDEDVWKKAEEILKCLEFESLEKTDAFYIVSAHANQQGLETLYEKNPKNAAMNLLVSTKDFTLTSIQNETLTYEDSSKETLPELDLLYDQGEQDVEMAKLLRDHFAQNTDYRSCTIIVDAQGADKSVIQYNIAKGVKSGVILSEDYKVINRLTTADNDACDNDVTYYVTNKEGEDMEKEHEGDLSKDGVYPDDASGFVSINEVIPDAILEIRYATNYNFMGDRVDGYEEPIALLTKEAAQALKGVAEDLKKQGYLLKIYDGYRPQKAVDHFVRWASDLKDARMKDVFYADVDKSELFSRGYIAEKSSHTRGSTVDLTLVDRASGKDVDMGSVFDLFNEISHSDYQDLTPEQLANRLVLRQAMVSHGFVPLTEEWWHFTLDNEPYPETYFNFPVNSDVLN